MFKLVVTVFRCLLQYMDMILIIDNEVIKHLVH